MAQRSPNVPLDFVEMGNLTEVFAQLALPTELVVLDAFLKLLGEGSGIEPLMKGFATEELSRGRQVGVIEQEAQVREVAALKAL